MNKSQKIIGLWTAALFIFLLAAGESRCAEGKDITLDSVTLQLKWTRQFQFAGYYAALEKGYYREAGLDVSIVPARPGLEPMSEVLHGKAEFGVGTTDVVLLQAKAEPVVVLAVIFQHSPLVLPVRKDAGVTSIHDLKGRRVMMEPHSAELLAYLESENLAASQLTLVPHSCDTKDLISGKVDAMSAYSTDEPFDLLRSGIDFLKFSPRSGGIDFYGDLLFTTDRQVRKHPRRVKAFLTASLRG